MNPGRAFPVVNGRPRPPLLEAATRRAVLSRYRLPPVVRVDPAGGTAAPKCVLWTETGRYLLRRRREEFRAPEVIAYDHSLLQYLRVHGLPVPEVVPTRDGGTWVEFEGGVYEIHAWLPGRPFEQGRLAQTTHAARLLARLHDLTKDFRPAGAKNRAREDEPAGLLKQLEPYLSQARGETLSVLERMAAELRRMSEALPENAYRRLPHCIVHGDFHPGNVLFQGDEVSAMLDFDWANRQSRLVDVRDGLYFFAYRRPENLEADDIWSLTQPAARDADSVRVFLEEYSRTAPLTAAERQALPLLLRSRLCQMRIRGARKVPARKRLRFLAWGIVEQLDRLPETFP